MAELGWARGSGDFAEERGLRRGEWYKVLEDQGAGWLVLDVNEVQVRITRDHLLVRRSQPKTWSVVRLTPAEAGGDEAQRLYLVCPSCHTRQPATGQPKERECPKCGKTYPVDWSDRA